MGQALLVRLGSQWEKLTDLIGFNVSYMPCSVLSLNHEGICRMMEIGRDEPGQD